MATYTINIPMTVVYTLDVERDSEGMTKEALLASISDEELSNGDLSGAEWSDIQDAFTKGDVDAQDETGADIS